MKRLDKIRLAVIALAAAGVLFGCASYKPYAYHNDRDEMPGRGLFSGQDGVFTIWGEASDEEPADSRDGADTEKGVPDEKLPEGS